MTRQRPGSRRAAGSRWRRAAQWAAGGLLVLVAIYAVRVPVLQWAGRQIVRNDEMVPSDALIVLGGGEPDREIAAADLFAAKIAPLVILATEREFNAVPELLRRGVRVERPVDQRRRYLREMGVPDAAIVTLPGAEKSTIDEARTLAAWVQKHPIRSLVVVTSTFHSRRAGFIFEWALRGSATAVRVKASAFNRYDPDHWWTDRVTFLAGVVEWQKTIYYRLRYW